MRLFAALAIFSFIIAGCHASRVILVKDPLILKYEMSGTAERMTHFVGDGSDNAWAVLPSGVYMEFVTFSNLTLLADPLQIRYGCIDAWTRTSRHQWDYRNATCASDQWQDYAITYLTQTLQKMTTTLSEEEEARLKKLYFHQPESSWSWWTVLWYFLLMCVTGVVAIGGWVLLCLFFGVD